MSSGVILVIAIVVVVVLAVMLVVTTSGRRDRDAAVGVLSRETVQRDKSTAGLGVALAGAGSTGGSVAAPAPSGKEIERAAVLERSGGGLAVPARAAPPAVRGPVDPETYGQTRRQFLNRGIVGLMVVSLAGFGAAILGFLWPAVAAGFGGKIEAGTLSDIDKQLATKTPFYQPVGRFYVNPYPTDAGTQAKAKKAYSPALLVGMSQGYVALYQRCVHLGCRVPWCQSSQWFECPCHGSKYSRVGEQRHGPAPRGLDRFAMSISGGIMTVDTSTVFVGPPIGTNTTGQGQEGPHCS
jgi:cytochrome b6-f complex iron-sulfur subunit